MRAICKETGNGKQLFDYVKKQIKQTRIIMGRGPKEKEEGKRGREKELVSVIDSDESKHHGTNLAKTRDFTAGNRHENSQGAKKTCLPSSFAKKFILSDMSKHQKE